MLARIVAGVGANGYAQLVTIGIQLASLPLFLAHWDLDTYGRWLVISAIPSYLALADVGLVTAAGNRMTMDAERDPVAANRVFQSALVGMGLVCGALLLLLALALWVLPVSLGVEAGQRGAIALLALGVVCALFGGLPEAVFRASGRYAWATSAATSIRLAEWAGGMLGLLADGSFVAVALGMLLPRAAGTAALVWQARRSAPAFRWGRQEASRAELRRLVAPAASFMVFPLANALSLQGVTLVVAGTLGPAAAAVFNTYRTLARVTVQASGVFSHALWPEFSRLAGGGDAEGLARLYRRGRAIGAALALLTGLAAYGLAAPVLEHWSQGRIAFEPALMALAMAYATAAGCWHVPRVLLLATNRHGALALQFLVVSALTLPAAAALAANQGVAGVIGAMLGAELLLLVCSLRGAQALLPQAAPTSKALA